MTKLSGTIVDGASRPVGRGTGRAPRSRLALFAAAGLMSGSLALAAVPAHAAMHTSKASKAIAAAVADPARPSADRERDALRKPAACLAFAGCIPA